MKRHTTLLLWAAALVVLLVPLGCASDYEAPVEGFKPSAPFTVTYTYPPHGATEIPLTGGLMVHYNLPIDPNTGAGQVSLKRVNEDNTLSEVPIDVKVSGATLVITPSMPLAPLSRHELTVQASVKSTTGEVAAVPAEGFFVAFDTEADRPQAHQEMYVTSVSPNPDTEQALDIHNFRIYFSEPLDQRSVTYGDTVLFTDAEGDLVDGKVFTRTSQIVFDPAEDLAPGTYTFTVTGELKDAGGERLLTDVSYTYEVKSTYPHATIYAENCPTTGEYSSCEPAASAAELPTHPLTGDAVNSMKVVSHLLGTSYVYMSGQLEIEQCSPFNPADQIPLTIRAGQRLYATTLPATLGGAIPTGLETGKITIQLLTDAIGMMRASDLANVKPGAPVALSLTMDAAMVTEDNNTNVMMAQQILGTQLFGQLSVNPDDGRLIMQIAGVGEIFVLGERMPSFMSLEMHDALEVFDLPADTAPPELKVSKPVNGATQVRLGDDIMLVFDEPVDANTARDVIRLQTTAGAAVSADVLVNAAKVLVRPRTPLAADTAYVIRVGSGLADILGNATTSDRLSYFNTGSIESSAEPPMITSVSPSPTFDPPAPGHLPFEIFFSQIMDPDTIELGDTFRVVDLSAGELTVQGTLVKQWYRYTFYPNEPLTAGHYYRIILSDRITNLDGVALDLDRDHVAGGPPGVTERWIDFVAAGANTWQQLILAADPFVDRDGSGYIDNTETEPDPSNNYFKIFLIPQKSYSNGYIVSYVRGLDYDVEGNAYMDIIMVVGNALWATSTQMDLGAIIDLIMDLLGPDAAEEALKDMPSGLLAPMGRILIDFAAAGNAPTVESPEGLPQMNITMDTYMTLDNTTFNSMLDHNLGLEAVGLLGFTADGRMVADITSNATMTMNLTIPIININIPLPLPVKIKMRQASLNAADWWNTL